MLTHVGPYSLILILTSSISVLQMAMHLAILPKTHAASALWRCVENRSRTWGINKNEIEHQNIWTDVCVHVRVRASNLRMIASKIFSQRLLENIQSSATTVL